jgi:hypothetical protein
MYHQGPVLSSGTLPSSTEAVCMLGPPPTVSGLLLKDICPRLPLLSRRSLLTLILRPHHHCLSKQIPFCTPFCASDSSSCTLCKSHGLFGRTYYFSGGTFSRISVMTDPGFHIIFKSLTRSYAQAVSVLTCKVLPVSFTRMLFETSSFQIGSISSLQILYTKHTSDHHQVSRSCSFWRLPHDAGISCTCKPPVTSYHLLSFHLAPVSGHVLAISAHFFLPFHCLFTSG